MSVSDVLRTLAADPERGLVQAEAERRLRAAGPNLIPPSRPPSWPRRIGAHLGEFFVLVLLAAAALSWLLGQRLDAEAILLIVLLNLTLELYQEIRAERALGALRRLAAPQADVLRDGAPAVIAAEGLVPGDLVLLSAGARVPADLRLVSTHGLAVDESLLTGESVAVYKHAPEICPADTPLAERRNLAFLGATVAGGRGRGVVVGTGTRTELGALARTLEEIPQKGTPLGTRLATLGRQLGIGAIGVGTLVFAAGVARGRPAFEMLLVAISLAVAAVPEGLPAAIGVALALGVVRMARQRAIVRRLAAVEALGTVTAICTDKTGTLTVNEMAVRRVVMSCGEIQVTGAGYEPLGGFLMDGTAVDPGTSPPLRALLEAAVLAGDGYVIQEDHGRWRPVGDPLEAAIAAGAMKAGLSPRAQLAHRIAEVPFSSERQRMLTVYRTAAGAVAYIKGAAESVVPRCAAHFGPAGAEALTGAGRDAVLARAAAMAAEGVRVIAVAQRPLPASIDVAVLTPEAAGRFVERDAVLMGLIGLVDPVRPEARAAIAEARQAGVRAVMISGDHPQTALSVARQVGITSGGAALTGADLDGLSDSALADAVRTCEVFARAAPQHKVRILHALKSSGEIVAMTGDGANDAPALATADVGVAMGRGGTDVAREAADLVLTDDNFATIVAAIREGRVIFDNIRKFVLYVLASNVGEVAVVLGSTLAGLPALLAPIQILWINLVTDGLPSAALAVDPEEQGTMRRPPRPPGQTPFAAGGLAFLITFGLIIATASLCAYLWGALRGEGAAERRTLLFLTLSLGQLLFAFACRSGTERVFGGRLRPNRWLVGAVLLSVIVQIAVVSLPGVQLLFSAAPLGGGDWAVVAGLSCVPLLASEGFKAIRRVPLQHDASHAYDDRA